jgi:hypothetical protein
MPRLNKQAVMVTVRDHPALFLLRLTASAVNPIPTSRIPDGSGTATSLPSPAPENEVT